MPTKPQPRRDGRRPRIGRPPDDAAGARRKVTIYLSPAELAHCQSLATSAPAAVRQLLAASMSSASATGGNDAGE